jgi:bifunctional non-homologous end joining protein LigD
MLATLVKEPFQDPGWSFEEKYDGFRLLAYKEGAKVTLLSRNDKDRTADYPDIAIAIAGLQSRTVLLDGELVAFDRHHVSHFQLLQQGKATPSYGVFDCLYQNGIDLRRQPLSVRRAALESVIPKKGRLFLSHRVAEDGLKAYHLAKKRGYEGIVAKELASPYIEHRSNKWLKVKVHQEDEFVVVGYTAPAGARMHFGALLLGAYQGKRLLYVGKVGTGFDNKTLAMLSRSLRPLIRRRSSVANPPREANITYVSPRLVAQIAFAEWTADRKLRQPVFLRLRDDKSSKEVILSNEI